MPSNTISNQMFSNTDTVIVRGHVIKDRNDLQNFRVLVIGLGQLGLPVAKYVKEKGFDTYGYDISQKAVERAEKLALIKGANSFSNFDIYIICVSTHIPEDIFIPQIDGLLSIVEEISRKAKNDSLVSIESTIPKGTSRKIFEMLDHRLHVVHVPHRWYAAEEVKHGVNQLRVIGGVYDCCLKSGMQFYSGMRVVSNVNESTMRSVHHNSDGSRGGSGSRNENENANLGVPLHPVSSIEIAEITKIAENAHRYLQIAFAEDLYLYCKSNDLNFPELREAVNTKWNVNILEPRDGIGGHCLPKDTTMFLQSSKAIRSKILTAALEVDRDYRKHRLSGAELEVLLCKD
jgi:UDP-N-acetyl-D-mannosaminuronic acid dehydrogenase